MPKSFPFLSRWLAVPRFWLGLVVVCNLLYFFLEHEGLYHQDDYSYASFAYHALQGEFCFTPSLFCHRFLVYLPTAAIYAVFGVNAYTTTLWPLVCTLATYLLLYLAYRRDYPMAISWALLFMGLFYFLLNTVNFLYPDNILLFFTTACLLILHKRRTQSQSAWKWGMAVALVGFGGFLVKETVVYLLPFCLLLAIYDLRLKKNIAFWLAGFLTGLLLLGGYFGLYALQEKGMWWRFQEIEAYNQLLKSGYLAKATGWALFSRLTYGPLLFFINSGMAVPLAFLVACLVASPSGHRWQLETAQGFWLWAVVFLLVPIWFGTVSLDHYKPMSLVPRMFHPLLPAFSLSAGFALHQSGWQKTSFRALTLVFLLCSVAAVGPMKILYVPFVLFFGVAWLVPGRRSKTAKFALPLLVAVQLIRPLYFIWKPSVSNYFAQERLMERHLPEGPENIVIYTDPVMVSHIDFFFGFEVPTAYTFREYTATSPAMEFDQAYLLVNAGHLANPEILGQPTPAQMLGKFPQARLVAQEEKVALYRLK